MNAHHLHLILSSIEKARTFMCEHAPYVHGVVMLDDELQQACRRLEFELSLIKIEIKPEDKTVDPEQPSVPVSTEEITEGEAT